MNEMGYSIWGWKDCINFWVSKMLCYFLNQLAARGPDVFHAGHDHLTFSEGGKSHNASRHDNVTP